MMNMMNDFEIVFSWTETIIWVESNNKATAEQRWRKLNVQGILTLFNFRAFQTDSSSLSAF